MAANYERSRDVQTHFFVCLGNLGNIVAVRIEKEAMETSEDDILVGKDDPTDVWWHKIVRDIWEE